MSAVFGEAASAAGFRGRIPLSLLRLAFYRELSDTKIMTTKTPLPWEKERERYRIVIQ
jgi:hypothetical protein